MVANASAHAREYLPLCSVDKAIFTQLREVQTRYEAEANEEEGEEKETWEDCFAASKSAKAVMGKIWSTLEQAELQSMRQALAEYEEKHGMDHPTTARMAWRLGLQLKGEDKEAMLMRAARALLECPGPAHEMTWECFFSLYDHLGQAAWADEDNAGIKNRLNNIRKQLLHTMAAGLLAGTSYGLTNVNWEELGYDLMEFGEVAHKMLDESSGYLTIYTAEALMNMIQGAERFLGADHVLSGYLLIQLYKMLEQYVEELTSMRSDLHAQGAGNKGSASCLAASGHAEQSADEKVEGDAKEADAASDAGSESEAEASAASAKHAMACKAGSFGRDIAARQQPKHETQQNTWGTPSHDDFQKYLKLFGKPHVHQADIV